ncbi:MAG: hypothetical protein J6K28_00400 [Alistipes sp.]|nr:hypothetical protein [Alistipes sp.]
MKKIFASILALAALAGCSEKLDEEIAINDNGSADTDRAELFKVYAEVSVNRNDGTRATYGEALDARWEDNDEIAVFQEHTAYGSEFRIVSALGILKGAGTSEAKFSGEITVGTTEPRLFHIAYPKDAIAFSMSDTVEAEGEVQYSDNKATGGHNYSATGSYRHTYTNNVTVTVPSEQDGKWEPYMFASTEEAVTAEQIGTRPMNVLTGSIAIRVFEHDGVTPKKVKKIIIASADNALTGNFTGSSVSYGSTGTVTGDDSGWFTAFNKADAQKKAVENLENKARQTVPASVVCSRNLVLDGFEGISSTVTLDNLTDIAADSDGNYTYYANIAPVSVGGLTITLIDENNFKVVRTTAARTFKAGARSGYNIRWADASISMDDATSWYDETSADFTSLLAGNTIYCNNLKIGGVDISQISKTGININGTEYPTEPATAIEQLTFQVESGRYTVFAYADITLSDGTVKSLATTPQTIYVTANPKLSYTAHSSYNSSDGSISKSNTADGASIWFNDIALNDNYLKDNLTDGNITIVYGSNSETTAFVGNKTYEKLTPAQYGCYIEVKLNNGYTLRSAACDIAVTGIPYTLDVASNDGTWEQSGSVSWGKDSSVQFGKGGGSGSITKRFYAPADINAKVTSTGSANSGVSQTTFTLSCSGATLVSIRPSRYKTENYSFDDNAVIRSSDSTIKFDNSYGLGATGANLHSFHIEYAN